MGQVEGPDLPQRLARGRHAESVVTSHRQVSLRSTLAYALSHRAGSHEESSMIRKRLTVSMYLVSFCMTFVCGAGLFWAMLKFHPVVVPPYENIVFRWADLALRIVCAVLFVGSPVCAYVWCHIYIALHNRKVQYYHCRGCGYDMRMNISGRCPECFTTIEQGLWL